LGVNPCRGGGRKGRYVPFDCGVRSSRPEGGEDSARIVSPHIDAEQRQPGPFQYLAREIRGVLKGIGGEDESVSTPPWVLTRMIEREQLLEAAPACIGCTR